MSIWARLCPLLLSLIFPSVLLLFSLLSSGRPSSPTLLGELQAQTPDSEQTGLCPRELTLWCGGGRVCLAGSGAPTVSDGLAPPAGTCR